MEPNLSTFLADYGESLASRLRVIGHSEAQKRYVYVDEMQSPEELLTASDSGLKPDCFVLLWERFGSENLQTGGRDNYTTRPQGSLCVVRKPSKEGKAIETQTISECRQVALKVIALLLLDQRTHGSVLDQQGIRFEVDGQSGESIPKLSSGWIGYGYTFELLAPLDLELTDDDLLY